MPAKQQITAITGLLSGAAVWGIVWYPFRILEEAGISGMLSSFLVYVIALLVGLAISGPVWRELRTAGWWAVLLLFSAGWTNFGYVQAIIEGEVMRVLLLFYLAPLWTVFFAHFLLGERLNRYGYAVIALSLGGAIVMLWQPQLGLPVPQSRAEWIGLSAGMSFALMNVIVRHTQHLSVNFKSASVWLGTILLTGMMLVYNGGMTAQISAISSASWGLLLLLGLVMCAVSFAVQFGLTHLPANRAIVLLLFELLFAAVAAYFLAGEKMGMQEYIGAVLIVSASLLSGRIHDEPHEKV
ncbi:MAG: EamA family transporter [Gallionellales bacterium 35-53-114]|nr:MAG: EamA family transporter [Gallionellales bacterium 35-53-114]OYZ64707.1 MAG: EamA family transporter [Gallionellales bacterium 24-53-125]OZB07754.1 MAG: EamA family transporter [Gallionellales bacterium 39-52-133]HQS58539.1 DMT family transporter [Gallionellaceae bacterium]HQS74880.1 DMT family transporter [Gallionellaceae bacterium]